MLLFNPLRRAELKDYRDKAVNKTSRGIKFTGRKIDSLTNTLSKFNISRKAKKVWLIIIIVLTVFFLSIYIPSWFTSNEQEEYYALANDPNAVKFNDNLDGSRYLKMDFDNDGLLNEDEWDNETNIFDPDTDGDGYWDEYEIDHEMNPNKKDSFEKAIKSDDEKSNTDLDTPYKDEDVVLWPDSYEDKAYGVVIKDFNGYIIRNFKGWAQFPNSIHRHVYNYKDGKLEKLKYREKEDAYYIKEDSYIIITEKEITSNYRFSFAGQPYIIKNNVIGNILCFLLPEKGKTYLKCQEIPQLNIKEENTTTRVKVVEYSNGYEERLTKNTNTTDDLSKVWNTIRNGKCVYVSFFNEEKGESIGIIYGYDYEGNLLIADPETGTYAGKMNITLYGKKILRDKNIEKYTWFEFEGLGFSSENNDRINFFGTQTDDNYIDYID